MTVADQATLISCVKIDANLHFFNAIMFSDTALLFSLLDIFMQSLIKANCDKRTWVSLSLIIKSFPQKPEAEFPHISV